MMKKIIYVLLGALVIFLGLNFLEFKRVIGDDPTYWRYRSMSPMNLEFGVPYQLGIWNKWQTNLYEFEYKQGMRSKYCFTSVVKNEDSGSCSADRFNIAAPSANFESPRGLEFTDTTGYKKVGDSYFITHPIEIELPAGSVKEITSEHGVNLIKIVGQTSEDESGKLTNKGTPGEGFIGAIINRQDSNYPGITIKMTLADDLSPELFEKILSTLRWVE